MDNPKFTEAKNHSTTMMIVHKVVGLVALIITIVCVCIFNNIAETLQDFVKGIASGSFFAAYLSLSVSDYEDGYSRGIKYGYVLGKDKTNGKK